MGPWMITPTLFCCIYIFQSDFLCLNSNHNWSPISSLNSGFLNLWYLCMNVVERSSHESGIEYSFSNQFWICTACNSRNIWMKSTAILPSIVSFWFRGRSQTTLTRFWLFFDHLPPCVDIFYGINVEKSGHFWTTYLPCLVNVVFEQTLIWIFTKGEGHGIKSRLSS